jgi:hypothetical protein
MKFSKLLVSTFAISASVLLSMGSSANAQTQEDADRYYQRKKVTVVEIQPQDELSEAQFKERINNEKISIYETVEIKIKASDPACQTTILNVSDREIFGKVEYTFSKLESPEEFSILANCGRNKKAQVFVEIWVSSDDGESWKRRLWIYPVRRLGATGEQYFHTRGSSGSNSNSSSSTTTIIRTWRWRSW